MVTHSLSGASGNFLQILTLITYYILFFIIATTPRRMSSRQFRMPNTNWGTVYPNITLLAVIGIAYSISKLTLQRAVWLLLTSLHLQSRR